MTISAAALATFEQLLNATLKLDPESPARLAPLHGKVIQIQVTGLGFSLFLIPDTQGIQCLGQIEGEADCMLRGTPWGLANLSNDRNSTEQVFSGAVSIEGDTALAQRFGDFIAALDIDWEEQLSRLTGDVAAHEIGGLFRSVLGWGAQARATAEQNLKEYLQEELRMLPSAYEVQPFLEEVDRLRDDVERLEARIQRLESARKKGDSDS
ncbi:MAG: SCP2 sterol-binding domain-containing protein [Candidatus Thiodiazotropha sp.]